MREKKFFLNARSICFVMAFFAITSLHTAQQILISFSPLPIGGYDKTNSSSEQEIKDALAQNVNKGLRLHYAGKEYTSSENGFIINKESSDKFEIWFCDNISVAMTDQTLNHITTAPASKDTAKTTLAGKAFEVGKNANGDLIINQKELSAGQKMQSSTILIELKPDSVFLNDAPSKISGGDVFALQFFIKNIGAKESLSVLKNPEIMTLSDEMINSSNKTSSKSGKPVEQILTAEDKIIGQAKAPEEPKPAAPEKTKKK